MLNVQYVPFLYTNYLITNVYVYYKNFKWNFIGFSIERFLRHISKIFCLEFFGYIAFLLLIWCVLNYSFFLSLFTICFIFTEIFFSPKCVLYFSFFISTSVFIIPITNICYYVDVLSLMFAYSSDISVTFNSATSFYFLLILRTQTGVSS